MRQRRYTTAVIIPVLMLLVWACGGNVDEPPTRTVPVADALPARPMEDIPVSTTENPPLPSSTASATTATVAEPEPDNTPTAMERPPVSYLEETIPLCTPIGGEDPCEAGPPPPRTRTSGTSHSALLPEVMPTISEMVLQELYPGVAPHMVVRATGIPGTSRCDGLYPVLSADFEPKDDSLKHLFRYYCFTDFRINEYIIGEGPPTLTMNMTTGRVNLDPEDWKTVDEQWVKEEFDLPDPDSTAKYEGREYIMMIGVAINLAVETWIPQGYYYSMWQITREDGELRAISPAINRLARTPEQRQALNRPLDEVLREIIEAVETRTTVNEGRIGPDPNLPNIITDANNLQDYYKAVGQVYEGENATVLPPPAPGAEEPEQDPTQTHENQPQQTEDTTPTPTTQPQTQDTTTTQPQTEDTTTTTTPTPGTTQPQTEDTIPTPTEPTQPPDDGTTTPAGTSEQPAQSE